MNNDFKGPIAWMARNHVAANLLMMICLVGGLIMLSGNMKQEIFPETSPGIVTITVSYPGASPSEVESAVILAVEDAIDGIEGIKEINSTATEGQAVVEARLYSDANGAKVTDEIKSSVDSITTFPDDAEDPVVEETTNELMVLQYVVHGRVPEAPLKELAEIMRDDLLKYDNVSKVEVDAVRPVEISIEVPQNVLRSYGLTLEDVADIIKNSAVEVPGGEIKTEGGKVLLRTNERRDWAAEFKDIIIVADADGAAVRLGDIATIRDSFEDIDKFAFFNGEPAVAMTVYRVGMQTPQEVAADVTDYLDRIKTELPPGVANDVLIDYAEMYRDRIHLLVKNALIGLILVMVFLGFFLQPSLAFWVTLGIPVSFLGSFLFLSGMDISINMISLFAFIITLGIVVDDAIVVGENIYEHRQHGDDRTKSSIRGAQEVAVPVVFSVLTTVAAFAPMLFVQGDWGQVLRNIPLVVITVLLISLFESLFILPAHLGRMRGKDGKSKQNPFQRFQSKFSDGIISFAEHYYGPAVRWCVRNRWQTFAIGLAVLIVAFGFVASGRINFNLMNTIQGDWVNATAVMTFDAPREEVFALKDRMEKAAQEVIDENGGTAISKGIISTTDTTNKIEVTASLVGPDERDVQLEDFVRSWRKKVGPVAGIESLKFEVGKIHAEDAAIAIELSHNNPVILEKAANELARYLQGYDGVFDVDNGFSAGKPQLNFKLTEAGRSLGLTASDLARQVRSAYYGVEAFSQQRGRDEVSVMVRLPENERKSVSDVNDLIIRTSDGGEIPLYQAASVERGTSYTSIERTDRKRIISVTADVDLALTSVDKVLNVVQQSDLPRLLEKYPGLTYSFAGEKKDTQEAMGSLMSGFWVALLVMYCLVAIPFRSYIQSCVVLLSIPFGFVGALIGHLLMGYNLSLLSMMGVVALSGVVINDSLVLVHTANRMQAEGMGLKEAVQQAGIRRFRPILLTSLTTFLGLAPMILETSIQARFLIPMALSLGFGVLFATLITLLLVPAFYIIEVDIKEIVIETFGDIKRLFRRHELLKN